MRIWVSCRLRRGEWVECTLCSGVRSEEWGEEPGAGRLGHWRQLPPPPPDTPAPALEELGEREETPAEICQFLSSKGCFATSWVGLLLPAGAGESESECGGILTNTKEYPWHFFVLNQINWSVLISAKFKWFVICLSTWFAAFVSSWNPRLRLDNLQSRSPKDDLWFHFRMSKYKTGWMESEEASYLSDLFQQIVTDCRVSSVLRVE